MNCKCQVFTVEYNCFIFKVKVKTSHLRAKCSEEKFYTASLGFKAWSVSRN